MKRGEAFLGNFVRSLIITCALSCALLTAQQPRADLSKPEWDHVVAVVDDKDILHVQAFDLPDTSFLSEQVRVKVQEAKEAKGDSNSSVAACGSSEGADSVRVKAIEECAATAVQNSGLYKRLRGQYPVVISSLQIAGVATEVFTPTDGVSRKNAERILINLHSGGFIGGWLYNSRLESIPIASVGRMKVISIDYREAPEDTFPAASEDATAVYREILKTYKPKNIGIFGCSSGGLLTAETVAWLQKEHLPLPGAIGIFCSGASYWSEGDSGYFARAIGGINRMNSASNRNPYFRNTDPEDVLAFPVRSISIMSKFPPTLIISATRDIALSSAVYTHSVLVNQGVDAELHVWEGMGHAFFASPDYPESHEVFSVTARFFDAHLGK